MKNGYKIDFVSGTITLTKAFAAQASIKGNDAYNTLIELKKDMPNMRFVTRTTPKKRKSDRLTYDKMKKFIRCQNDADILLIEFDTTRELSKSEANPYQYVKKWFVNTFPNYKDIPSFDGAGNLISDFGRKEQTKVFPMEQTAPVEKLEERKTA